MIKHIFLDKKLIILAATLLLSACKSKSTDSTISDAAIADSLQTAQREQQITDSLKTAFIDEANNIVANTPDKPDNNLNTSKELLDYLPEVPKLKTNGDAVVKKGDLNNNQYLQISQYYTTADGNTASISITDYGTNSRQYAMALAVLRYSGDSDNGAVQTEPFNDGNPDLIGRTTYNTSTREATAMLGVANRFFISSQADNQKNTELVEEMIDNIDLDAIQTLEQE